MAFANPYRIQNLIMPFRQAESGAWTKEVLFWSPLLKFSKTQGLVLYTGIRAAPFLIHLSIVALLLCIVLVLQGRKGIASFSMRSQSNAGEDMLTEVMISVFLVVLAFRFGRTILFTAPALIPLTGYLLGQFMGTQRGTCGRGSPVSKRNSAGLLLLVQCFLTAVAILWFRFETLPPYLPHNPFVDKEPLSEKVLGSFSTQVKGLTGFMRENRVMGRVCSSWQLADVLLWKVPGVQIFLDLRAQSLYSDKLRNEYNAIFRVDPHSPSSVSKALRLLDLRQVRAVAIDKRLEPSSLPVVLSASRRWVPIYQDAHTLFYMRSHSREAACLLKGDSATCVRYPDPATRALSLATLWLETGSPLPPEIEEELRRSVVNHPSALAYKGICVSDRRRSGILTSKTKAYLWSEFLRLGKLNYHRPGGYDILSSRAEILGELKKAGFFSLSANTNIEDRRLSQSLFKQIEEVWSRYLPWSVSRPGSVPNGI